MPSQCSLLSSLVANGTCRQQNQDTGAGWLWMTLDAWLLSPSQP